MGRRPLARFPASSGEPGCTRDDFLADAAVSPEDLEYAVAQLGGEFGQDNRAGVDRTLHRVSCMRSRSGKVVGLTARVGRAVAGSAAMGRDLVSNGFESVLLLGRPGVGKTTAIREVSRVLADEFCRRVVIVDTSNEAIAFAGSWAGG